MTKKKRKRNKNPVLEKKFNEGFKLGFEQGEINGIAKSTQFFIHKFKRLEEVEGIGPKTFSKIKAQLGEKYFE